MTEYAAFLRAVNVAGHGRVRMSAVRDAFLAAGCSNVRTYLQSGNVLFKARAGAVGKMLQAVRVTLRRVLGEEPEILLRKRRDVEGLLGAAPFTPRQASSTTKLYVTFLSRRSLVRPRLPLGSPKERLEAVAMTDLEVFLVSRRKKNGFYGFPNGFVEETLGVSATTRNWSTVKKLVELARREHDG